MNAKEEKLGWRDERISQFHRELGYDYPAVDIDFLLCEFDSGIPVALIEHKHENFKDPTGIIPSFTAIRALADAAHIPFFLVKYSEDLERFEVQRQNSIALAKCQKEFVLSRDQYARWLKWLRDGMRK